VNALILSAAQAALIETEARRVFPREACGLLLGMREEGAVRVARVVPAPNMAEDADRFEIDPRLLFALRRAGRQDEAIVGHYHSHPHGAAAPSARDETEAAWPGLAWLIIGMEAGGEPQLAAFLHPAGAEPPVTFLPLALRIEPAAP